MDYQAVAISLNIAPSLAQMITTDFLLISHRIFVYMHKNNNTKFSWPTEARPNFYKTFFAWRFTVFNEFFVEPIIENFTLLIDFERLTLYFSFFYRFRASYVSRLQRKASCVST